MCNYILFAQSKEEKLQKYYNDKNYDILLIEALEVLKADPQNPAVNLIIGRTLVDQGRFDEGELYIKKAIEYDVDNSWRKAWALCYRGLIEFFSDDIKAAKKSLEECNAMNATKNVNNYSKRLLMMGGMDDFYKDWVFFETEHLRFYFQPISIVVDKKNFIELREEAFLKINSFFCSKLPKKIDCIVWNGNEDSKKIGIKQLGFAEPGYCCIHMQAHQTRGHEITHVISYYCSRNPTITKFINEGLATAFDLTNENKLQKAKLFKERESCKEYISIKKAWENPNIYPEWIYYPLAGEFIIRILKEGGKEKLLKLVSDQTLDNAEKLYGKTLDKIITELEKEIN